MKSMKLMKEQALDTDLRRFTQIRYLVFISENLRKSVSKNI
jgi:hypothetical protein